MQTAKTSKVRLGNLRKAREITNSQYESRMEKNHEFRCQTNQSNDINRYNKQLIGKQQSDNQEIRSQTDEKQ